MTAGNAPLVLVRVQHDDFDAAAESARLTAGRQDVGALSAAVVGDRRGLHGAGVGGRRRGSRGKRRQKTGNECA